MEPTIPRDMKAAAIEHFGGPEELTLHTVSVPKPDDGQILIRVESAGVGVWDPYIREGKLFPEQATFPYVLGTEGAGTVVAVGSMAKRFQVGDRVYAHTLGDSSGGFYAEYVAVDEDSAAPLPKGLSMDAAGSLAIDGVTALCGLEVLDLKPGQSLLIYGASGGMGHLAIQLAKRLGVRVFAVASGDDGVELALKLHADAAVDGHSKPDDLVQACKNFAPDGLDAALVLASGDGRDLLLKQVRPKGRIAYPHGVNPEPKGGPDVKVIDFDGEPNRKRLEQLNKLVESGPFYVEVTQTFGLNDAAKAHQQIGKHHLGKLGLKLH